MIRFQYNNDSYPPNQEQIEKDIIEKYKDIDAKYPNGEIVFTWKEGVWMVLSTENNFYSLMNAKGN